MSVQPHFMGSMTLKALLEDPNLKNPPAIGQSSDLLKIKKEDDGSDLPQFNYGSAFLGPNLWDRTLEDADFNLEYMDLDEFLSENGIPIGADESVKNANAAKVDDPILGLNVANPMPSSPRQYLKTPPHSPHSSHGPLSPHGPHSPHSPVQYMKPTPASPAQYAPPIQSGSKSPTPPVSPFSVEFQVSDQDLALTSIPDYGDDSSHYKPKWQGWTAEKEQKNGQEDFDPRKRNFTEEELKPQPIIKKSKKVFVPEDLKDDKYWARRHKNNFAAKRSRDARRVKENQIAMRAAFLEKENSCLRDEMSKLRKENAKLKAKVAKYEGTAPTDDLCGLSLPQ